VADDKPQTLRKETRPDGTEIEHYVDPPEGSVMSPNSDHWWNHASNWVQLALGFIALGSFLFTAVMWAMTSWADERYVQHPQLVEALEVLSKSIDKGTATTRQQNLEDEIEELQDDIVFFSDEGSEASVKRRCRKLPKAIRKWEAHTNSDWEPDPVVRSACGVVQ